jgi:hypothetical protein
MSVSGSTNYFLQNVNYAEHYSIPGYPFLTSSTVSAAGTVEINFGNANWQIFRIAANTSFTIVGYPNDVGEEQGAKITLELTGDGTSRTITFPEDGIIGIKKSASFPTTVQSESNPILIEISTRAVSTGRIIFLNYLGQFSS